MNDLGFLREPGAGEVQAVLDNFNVQFVSTSTQDGGVKWIFGDGDTLVRNEYQDTNPLRAKQDELILILLSNLKDSVKCQERMTIINH